MSKERARRRAEREVAREAERARRHRSRARRDRWRTLGRPFTSVALRMPGRARPGRRPSGLLARRRRSQDGMLLAVLLCAHALLWLFEPSWWWRGSALVATAAVWPLLTVLLFDRRSSA